MMLEIELINNRSGRLIGSREIIAELSEYLAEEDPRAKFVTAYKRGFWDGVVRFIGARDIFPIGLLPRIYNYCHNHLNITPKIYDNRGFIHKTCTIPHILGDKKLRDYQYKAAYLALNRSVGKTPFPRGIIAAATNAGKSLISAAIAKALLDNKVDILFLCHRAEIFDQIFEWYGEYLETDVGRYNTKFNDIRNVTVGMITTLYARRKSSDVRAMLEHFKCLIVDEAHHASSKSWSSIIYSTNGSIFMRLGLKGCT